MNNNINIVFITNDKYLMFTYIAIMSIYEHKLPEIQYVINIVGINLSDDNKKTLNSLKNTNFDINIVNRDESDIKELKEKKKLGEGSFHSSILYKLKIDTIFNNIDKILYLDSDIIVNIDLSGLFYTDISNYYIAACKDISPRIHHLNNNKKEYKQYINAGVMLLNLKKIREDKFFLKVQQEYINNSDICVFLDQDAINRVIDSTKTESLKLLSYVYNWIISNNFYTSKQLSNFYNEDIKYENIGIIHYAGCLKPWVHSNIFYSKQWDYFYMKSPYAKNKLIRDSRYNVFRKFHYFIKKQWHIMRNIKLYKSIGIIK